MFQGRALSSLCLALRFPLAASALSLLLSQAASALPVVIDDFGDPQSLTVSGGVGPLWATGGVFAPAAIGGNRFVRLDRTSGHGTDIVLVDGGDAGLFELSSAAADTATARIVYDGGTDNVLTPTGLGDVDLTSGGTNGAIRILARSDLVAPIAVTVYTDAGNFSTGIVNLPGLGFGATPFTELDLPFSAFLADMGTGADFHHVGAIAVFVTGESVPALDVQIDSIVATVPEPGTLLLLAAGISGIGLAGRRDRAA